jgi:methylmalonyl-CoA mutase C-terminal domain/subunit
MTEASTTHDAQGARREKRRLAPIRVLLAKPGLDGHDRGIKVILRALRDAGMEVIYTGLRATPAGIAQAALQEDVDAVGLSNLSGAHRTLFPAVIEELRRAAVDLHQVVLFGGGIIPPEQHEELRRAGFRAIFTPGTSTAEIVAFLEKEVPA